ncbi:sulfite exporter TauE/SafE family protein [Halieaceae bacterium]|nr:sulfite exporter TauE/SafE family protein [Halieaceae bacterium]
MSELLLIPIAFFTSTLAAAIGLGGGVLLIALMPGLIPTAAIIPVHAVTQLASNASRAAFGWRLIDWRLMAPVLAGALLGAWFGAEIYSRLDLRWLPAVIGGLILLLTWLPVPAPRGKGSGALLALGFYQTGLGMVAGATGPLGAAVLARYRADRDWLVVNTGMYMTINHLLRSLAFGLLGFVFIPWLGLIAGMVAASIAGSWAGTRVRRFLPQRNFQMAFKVLVSLLALRMIALPMLQAG